MEDHRLDISGLARYLQDLAQHSRKEIKQHFLTEIYDT